MNCQHLLLYMYLRLHLSQSPAALMKAPPCTMTPPTRVPVQHWSSDIDEKSKPGLQSAPRSAKHLTVEGVKMV